MTFRRASFLSLFLAAAALFAVPQISFAYLDPGTGSYIIQLIIAAGAAGAFLGKAFFLRVKDFFLGMRRKKTPPTNPPEADKKN
jgi:hypothetical protein